MEILYCGMCGINMELKERATHIDGYQWKCPRCLIRRSLRTNSFFELFPKTPLSKLVVLIYFWSVEVLQVQASTMLGMTPQMVGKVCRALRLLCSRDVVDRPVYPFGGPNHVCKCDETVISFKRKYGRGRISRQRWVFGLVTTAFQPCRGYYTVVNKRTREVLAPIIQEVLQPGSVLHSDDWGTYRNITAHAPNVSSHRVVVHKDYFVDPVTGVNTQEIESTWARVKRMVKSKKGIPTADLQSHLDEVMWRQWRGEKCPFDNMVLLISRYYRNTTI
ncbi:uncharacterized protein LOC5521641 isoform X1 [Nematostella vectensis]|nr:uncharacterized protein LOC5521641 isoform X1 [Nematostella vectensis]